jgi:hypothetical protein
VAPTAAIAVEQVQYGLGRPCHSYIVKEFVDPDGKARMMKLSDKQKQSKTPVRARNAAPSPAKPDKKDKQARRSKAKPAKAVAAPAPAPVPNGAMKLQVRLEKNGRSIGIEVPDSVMGRLGDERRPTVTVEIHDTSFETTIGTSNGRRFIAVNAERRKAAGIDIDDTFFMALSMQKADLPVASDATVVEEVEPSEAPAATTSKPKPRRRRSSRSRSKA